MGNPPSTINYRDNLAKLLISSLISLMCAVNSKFKRLVVFVTQLPNCQQSEMQIVCAVLTYYNEPLNHTAVLLVQNKSTSTT